MSFCGVGGDNLGSRNQVPFNKLLQLLLAFLSVLGLSQVTLLLMLPLHVLAEQEDLRGNSRQRSVTQSGTFLKNYGILPSSRYVW